MNKFDQWMKRERYMDFLWNLDDNTIVGKCKTAYDCPLGWYLNVVFPNKQAVVGSETALLYFKNQVKDPFSQPELYFLPDWAQLFALKVDEYGSRTPSGAMRQVLVSRETALQILESL